MALPKRKTSKERKRKRRVNLKANNIHTKKCKKCGSDVLPHRICSRCNTYN